MKKRYDCLVNKKRGLSKFYVPTNLVVPNVPFVPEQLLQEPRDLLGSGGKHYMEETAAKALERLFQRAKKEGVDLVAISGFRSYERQGELFQKSVEKNGEAYAKFHSARAGHSEHQTGLAMDVSAKSVNYELEEKFGETKEGMWLKENGEKEGFIIRYPKGKEKITEYAYEPWHIRYVGKEIAKRLQEQDLVLEQLYSSFP